ncbi:MAG: sigma-54-dependent Fis family transcriptional regulator, partial [Candidatus Mariimomonas ferrooxydans]
LIVDYQLKRFTEIHNKRVNGISAEAMDVINSYDWPGNIRELMNCLESAIVMTTGNGITVESLPSFLFVKKDNQQTKKNLSKNLFEIEKEAILDVLNKVGGNKVKAAKALGIGLRTLYRKVEQYGLK